MADDKVSAFFVIFHKQELLLSYPGLNLLGRERRNIGSGIISAAYSVEKEGLRRDIFFFFFSCPFFPQHKVYSFSFSGSPTYTSAAAHRRGPASTVWQREKTWATMATCTWHRILDALFLFSKQETGYSIYLCEDEIADQRRPDQKEGRKEGNDKK